MNNVALVSSNECYCSKITIVIVFHFLPVYLSSIDCHFFANTNNFYSWDSSNSTIYPYNSHLNRTSVDVSMKFVICIYWIFCGGDSFDNSWKWEKNPCWSKSFTTRIPEKSSYFRLLYQESRCHSSFLELTFIPELSFCWWSSLSSVLCFEV